MRIGMLGQDSLARSLADANSLMRINGIHELRDFFTAAYAQYFFTGLEKLLDSVPCIADQTSRGPGCLEHSSGR